MKESKLVKIEKQIEKIKSQLLEIGEMRPGSLTSQYRNPKDKKWAFYQISYTHKMKSKTEYVRQQHVADIKLQVKAYKKFKALMEKWIDLAIEHSKLKMELANQNQLN